MPTKHSDSDIAAYVCFGLMTLPFFGLLIWSVYSIFSSWIRKLVAYCKWDWTPQWQDHAMYEWERRDREIFTQDELVAAYKQMKTERDNELAAAVGAAKKLSVQIGRKVEVTLSWPDRHRVISAIPSPYPVVYELCIEAIAENDKVAVGAALADVFSTAGRTYKLRTKIKMPQGQF